MSEWTPDDVARLASRYVVVATGCWMWRGARCKAGYGHIWISGRKWRAHRASYEMHVGPIPDGLVLDHLCRNRACVNPAHLEPVSDLENRMRGVGHEAQAARTGECANGHPFDERNTYVRPDGRGRSCRACRRAAHNQYMARRAVAS